MSSKRIAVLSPRDPVPVYTGLLERTYQTCRVLGNEHTVNVYFPYEKQRKRSESGRVPDDQPFARTGLESRAIDALERLIPEYSALKGLYHLHPWLYPSLREHLRAFDPDVVLVEFPYLVPLAKLASRGLDCRVVLSEHNVEYKFAQRLDIPLWRALRRFEIAACNRADAVFAVSEADRDELAPRLDDGVDLRVAPNGVDVDRYSPERADAAESIRERYGLSAPVLVFHGNLGNAQNAEVVDLLVEEVFPAVRDEFADASLLLIGAGPPESTPDGVVCTGVIDDLPAHVAAADVAVAPMLSGSGTNLKILEYLATGLPVVTTPIGAEGLSLTHGETALVADHRDAAAETVRVLRDDALRERLSSNGRDLAVSAFSWTSTLTPYREVVREQTGSTTAERTETPIPQSTPDKR
ncbi:glycosyltransferase family 4 protein [Halosimplex amylolyticum]|uniref:glycosyltransferase family 4 protein n=1 Tax=Halosimplex amylolyticum TaxID=3396616 RepID=UPI003F5530BD